MEFPSDHAVVSAVFHVRPRPAPDPAAGAGGAARQPSARPARPPRPARRADGRERTLYDYWGIGEKPKAFGAHGKSKAGARAVRGGPGGSDDGATSEEEVAKLVKEHYQRLLEGRALNDLDARKERFSKSSDRSVWILFSTRPYTMAIRKLWFQVRAHACVHFSVSLSCCLYLCACVCMSRY